MLPQRMPVKSDASIVKIAVKPLSTEPQYVPQLIEFDQRQPLTSIINELCLNWNLTNCENYSLKFTDSSFDGYVTEKNRSDVKNGFVLKLNYRERLEFALKSFTELMDHGTVSWEILSEAFINRNIVFIEPPYLAKSIIESSLSILENIVQNSSKCFIVERSVTFENLLKLLRDTSPVIQQNTIALINALFIKADDSKRKVIANTFSTKQYRSVIYECVLNATMGTEMTHQLSILQSLTLGMLEPRMNDRSVDQDAQEKIKELRRIAFEGEGSDGTDTTTRRQNNPAQHYKKLGFKCDINPAQDFMESSLLALDCMIYFARNYSQLYTKVVHENSCRADEYECPFGRTSIELVKVLCDILKIGESSDQMKDFHPMFFTHDHPFEEFFCICIVALNKTWKDMRATNEDFSKVFDVVREQIVRNLAARPRDFESFRQKMNELSYFKITEMRQQERTAREECESTASAIVTLKEKIRPEIILLIKEQRLGYLVEGTRFSKFIRGTRSKDKFWYVRLSPNHKILHYGDCDEKTVPLQEELKSELRVNEMKQLLVNKECPHIKEMKGRKPSTLFSIAYDDNGEQKTLDFVAPDDMTFNYWIDGIACLLDQQMLSKQMADDFETLLSVEIKLRLLDTEGVDISKEPPPIPDSPEDYEFNFEG
ncbi:CLUMA_CG015778, isoform A [Clunio marinus]|uniref:CLUMA_CG015778, isoform A n=1 Tax=Clunio marinus TaxID=568069 RepID=A0A1J1ISQ0_9DIPT|nr:CLUMA_CG015778, isoform A [Clunio marinus]